MADYDSLERIQKKISYLVGAKLRDKDRIKSALSKQDEIRKKLGSENRWKSVAEIRKWRETN